MKAKREGIGVAELKRQLASGACAPIYVLLGEESYLRETALAAIRRVVLGAEDQETGFNYDLLYGDETDALEVLNRCDTFPAFADRRLVVIRNVGALPARETERLLPYLQARLESISLDLGGDDLDGRPKFSQSPTPPPVKVDSRPLDSGS